MKDIRLLRPNEIDVRVQSLKKEYIIAVMYKDARVDMKILDETFGPMNWQRKHEVINNNLFCTVSVYDYDKKAWISKEDVGIPSNTQAEKGEASDAFKRACTNIGIGRELYTSPFLYIKTNNGEVTQNGNRFSTKTKFYVKEIDYNNDREISHLVIVDNKGNVRYSYGNKQNNQSNQITKSVDEYRQEIAQLLKVKEITNQDFVNWIVNNFGTNKLENLPINKLQDIQQEVASW